MSDAIVAAIRAERYGGPKPRSTASQPPATSQRLQYDLDFPSEDQFHLLAAPTLVFHSS